MKTTTVTADIHTSAVEDAPRGEHRPQDPVAAALALLRDELGAEIVHDGPAHGCPVCAERHDRLAA